MIVSDADKERLFNLILERGSAGCDIWRQELESKQADIQRQAEERAKNNPMRYGVKRVEQGYRESSGVMLPIMKAVEHFDVAIDDMPKFSHFIGARLEELRDLVEGRVPELVLKSGRYRAWTTPRWSHSKDYRDLSQEQEDREVLEREDVRTRQWVDAWNEKRVASDKPEPALPVASMWLKSSKKG
jgi:hypothetical protein